MAAPTYTAGTVGNVINALSLAHGKNAAALVSVATDVACALHCLFETASSAITAAVTFALYRAFAASATGNTYLTAAPTSGATSITVNSATGINKGQNIALISASTGVGEIVTVSAISGTTLTVSATENAYSTNDYVFLIEQTATGGNCAPGVSPWSTSTAYSTSLYPQPWIWILGVNNTDTTNSVTVTVTLDLTPTYQ